MIKLSYSITEKLLLSILFCLFFTINAKSQTKEKHKKEFYVAIDGNDLADGSNKTPFATITKAVNSVRDLRRLGNKKPIVIYLREGRHQLKRTLVLGIQDGSPITSKKIKYVEIGAKKDETPTYLTFAAYPNEKPVISAGVPVEGWKLFNDPGGVLNSVAKGKVWIADIPQELDKFYTLYDNKGRLNRARTSGFNPTKIGDKKTFHFPKGVIKNWENLKDVEVHIRPNRAWLINMLPLESVDEENSIAKTSVSATYDLGKLPDWVHKPDGNQAWIENVLEALDESGEWVVDTKKRKIYLWPRNPDSNGAPTSILAPSTSELIRVEGAVDYDEAQDKPVYGITFFGLTFMHGDRKAWTNEKERLGWGMQHDWDMFDSPTAMLRFRGAEDCQVINCNFINSGGSAIRLDLHAQNNRIENCELAHLGEAGILLAGYGAGTKDVNHHNEITNNHIHHFSEITWHSPGIWAWQSGYNRITNNYVHHAGYGGILITNRVEPDRDINGQGGRTVRQHEIVQNEKKSIKETYENWKVREKYNHSRHNILEYNEITNVVQKLSDGNAIYISGAGTGNIIKYNYIHDNLKHSFPAAIRCDNDQHETLIYGNILYKNYGFSAGIASKGVNDIINNFIVAPLTSPAWGYISFEWVSVKGSKVHNNIIISHPTGGKPHSERPIARSEDGDPLLVETDMDSNVYYHLYHPNWVEDHLLKMRAVGNEKSSLFGNPLFINPEKGNFGFQENSPAIKLGIESLDASKMGRIRNTEK